MVDIDLDMVIKLPIHGLGTQTAINDSCHPLCTRYASPCLFGGCQNYGPFLGPYYNTGPNTGPNLGDPRRDHNFNNPPVGMLHTEAWHQIRGLIPSNNTRPWFSELAQWEATNMAVCFWGCQQQTGTLI